MSLLRKIAERVRIGRRSADPPPVKRRAAFESLGARVLLSADLSDIAAEFVYELNRIRVAPDTVPSMVVDYGLSHDTTQPLAINSMLQSMASQHAGAMADRGFFAHTDPDSGLNANQRARESGYSLAPSMPSSENNIELIAGGDALATSQDVMRELLLHQADSMPHRRELMLGIAASFEDHSEIGVGTHFDESSNLSRYWSISIGHRSLADRFITGFVYDDVNANGRFDAGEGRANILVRSGALATTTNASGQYSLPVGTGVHFVSAIVDASEGGETQQVRVEDQNVQVDFALQRSVKVNYRERSLWTHATNHLDVNGSGSREPLDALIIINYLNRFGSTELTFANTTAETPYLDTNGDSMVTPLDALMVINHLNRLPAGEGESSAILEHAVSVDLFAHWSCQYQRDRRE